MANKIRNLLGYVKYVLIASGSLAKTIYLMNKDLENGVMRAPFFRGIKFLECSKYARMTAEKLSGARYSPAPAWDLGNKNKIIRNINGNLENFVNELIPGKTIILFHNPWSGFNREDRIGTHATVYLGIDDDIIFAEQYFFAQRAIPYSSLKKRGFIARQILAPKQILSFLKPKQKPLNIVITP